MLESLEERVTPSAPAQTAGSYADLVNAVAADTAAHTNYVIQITNNFSFDSRGQVSISKLDPGSTLTIEGQNGTNFILTGNGNRLFDIASGQNVTFADLTLTGGTVTNSTGAAQGGGVRDLGGNVTLSAVAIQGNTVEGNLAEGGGIYVSGGGNLTMKSGSVIQSNNATAHSFAAGGGVYVFGDSTVAISDSILRSNSATGRQGANGTSPGASGANGGTAYGGGLDVNGSDWTVTLTGVSLSGNRLIGGNGGNGAAGQDAIGANATGGAGGQGGQGGFATGGGAYFFVSSNGNGHLTILDDPAAPTTNPSEWVDNVIQSGGGGNGGNGGISTGTANNANGGNAGSASPAVGGGIFISSAAGGTVTATINNAAFGRNQVYSAFGGAGGAAGTGGTGNAGVAGTSFGGSFAVGGGITLENGVNATIKSSSVNYNTADLGVDTSGLAEGGGISELGGSVTLSKVTVQNNSVGAALASGGGIFVSKGSNLSIQGGSVIQSNLATGGSFASGGGVYVNGPSTARTTVAIRDSILNSNRAQDDPGADGRYLGDTGGNGGNASGGGLFVTGSGWTTTLTGVTLSGNAAVGSNGGNGAAGSNATGANATGGNGGKGGGGGFAGGGAAYIVGQIDCRLTILDDPAAPVAHPSIMIDNTVQSGAGGTGGAGGASTGTANNSNGGDGGFASGAVGGALFLGGSSETVTIGNTTFYGNTVTGGNPGLGGAAGTGGTGTAGNAGANPGSVTSSGGGLDLEAGKITLVNSTVAKNSVTAGSSNGGTGTQGDAIGGGILIENFTAPAVFTNNTITQNTIRGGIQALGSGVYVPSSNLTLINNLIQGNQSLVTSANNLETFAYTLSNASNNFITSVNANAVSSTSNIIGNSQTQLGEVVGVSANGNSTGGPIYYPLLPGTVSIGAGTHSALNTIASVERTTPANATDEIGGSRSSNGSIDLGAVQFYSTSAPTITANPSSQTVTAGASVSFTASANGASSVQWRVSTDGGKTFTNINGATSTTLTLHKVTTAMNGYEYDAVFTNSAGQVITSAATLTVKPVPPPSPPVLNVPPLLAFLDSLFRGIETVNNNGTETITDSLLGIPLLVSTFDSSGNLVSVTLLGFSIPNWNWFV